MKWNITLLIFVLVSGALNLSAQCCGAAGCGYGMVPDAEGLWSPRPYYTHWSTVPWLTYPDYAYYGYQPDLSCAHDHYSPQPYVNVVVSAPKAPAPSSPLQPPPASVTREYSWPNSGNDGGTEFAIVSKDGTVHRAIAAWIQDGRLCFVTLEGIGRELPLDEIDRQNTSRTNGEKKLKLLALNGPESPLTNPHTSE